ncbi:MAG TPA: FAD-binding oxidoreductase [Solirubrobacteraceae bacterium]|nr:FAD-binding oxidoreductase [Solirubrobacteraceae bacterium]
MSEPSAPEMRWWGWGSDDRASALPEHAEALLRAELQTDGRRRAPVALEQLTLAPSRLKGAGRDVLARALGSDGVREDRLARVIHAAGKSYPDLVRVRSGQMTGAPDGVLYPSTPEQVQAVLTACAEARIAVVPFGGGTSVVGGVDPAAGEHSAVVALDLRGLAVLVSVDVDSLTAVVQAGMRGPALERELARWGLTLGHFPQSFEYVSVGGCVATRSAGQASTGYGRIDELVLGLRCCCPSGEIALPARPASAAGPDLRQLVVGSEGVLGVITEVSLRLHRRPETRRYEGLFFRSFTEGAQAFRHAVQEDLAPDIARLSDESETRLSLALAGREGLKARLGETYLGARGYAGGCLAIVGWEGTEADVDRRRAGALALLTRHGALRLGASPGHSWAESRFAGPYLRDELLDRRIMADTLETAAQWSDIEALHAAVASALKESLGERGTPPLVMCHISHLYESGASLYFTILARQEPEAEIEQWQAAKRAASEAIVARTATITHHHGIGRDHVPWLEAETGPVGLAALRAAKQALDPAGIMNPGKLLG